MIRPGCMVKKTFVSFQKGTFLWQILIGTKVLCYMQDAMLISDNFVLSTCVSCYENMCVCVTSPSCITINPPW